MFGIVHLQQQMSLPLRTIVSLVRKGVLFPGMKIFCIPLLEISLFIGHHPASESGEVSRVKMLVGTIYIEGSQ